MTVVITQYQHDEWEQLQEAVAASLAAAWAPEFKLQLHVEEIKRSKQTGLLIKLGGDAVVYAFQSSQTLIWIGGRNNCQRGPSNHAKIEGGQKNFVIMSKR